MSELCFGQIVGMRLSLVRLDISYCEVGGGKAWMRCWAGQEVLSSSERVLSGPPSSSTELGSSNNSLLSPAVRLGDPGPHGKQVWFRYDFGWMSRQENLGRILARSQGHLYRFVPAVLYLTIPPRPRFVLTSFRCVVGGHHVKTVAVSGELLLSPYVTRDPS